MAVIRYLSSPVTNGLTDVVIDCYDEQNVFVQTLSLTEIDTTGVYTATMPANATWGIIRSQTLNSYDLVRLSPTIHDVLADLTQLKNVEFGAWKIQGSQMIFYDQNGTVIATFNLLDANGNPVTNPGLAMQRVPA